MVESNMIVLKKYNLLVIAGVLASCSVYQPDPLPTHFSLPDTIPHLLIDQQNRTSLKSHPIDPSNGLDMDEVATVAVLNNPDLKIARADAGIARAQAFSAGLLPDPQLALSSDLSNTGVGPGSVRAFSAGISYDFLPLLTYHANDAAAQAEFKKIDLNLLWQEWQVVAQARLLYVKLTSAQKLQSLLEKNRDYFSERVNSIYVAVNKNIIGNEAVLPDQSALQDVQRQLNDLERQTNQNRHDLNALLGVSPDAQVLLREGMLLPDIDEDALAQNVNQLLLRRPDLMALESGFQAQDERYRAALLAQFPALNVGFTHARDNAGIYSDGLGVTLSLPLFNRNRGNVAIEKATRDKLVADYQLRLDSANSDIHRMLVERSINSRQLHEIQISLIRFSAMASNADTALQKNSIDTLIVSNAHTALLTRQVEEIGIQQAMLEQQVALLALIGGELPVQLNLEKN